MNNRQKAQKGLKNLLDALHDMSHEAHINEDWGEAERYGALAHQIESLRPEEVIGSIRHLKRKDLEDRVGERWICEDGDVIDVDGVADSKHLLLDVGITEPSGKVTLHQLDIGQLDAEIEASNAIRADRVGEFYKTENGYSMEIIGIADSMGNVDTQARGRDIKYIVRMETPDEYIRRLMTDAEIESMMANGEWKKVKVVYPSYADRERETIGEWLDGDEEEKRTRQELEDELDSMERPFG